MASKVQNAKRKTQNAKIVTLPVLRRWLLPAWRFFLLLLISIIGAMVLVSILVIVQGGYSDARQVGTILVLPPDCNGATTGSAQCEQEAVLDHAIDLYRHGYATRLLLLGSDDGNTAARDYLQAHGLTEPALLLAGGGVTRWQQVRQASELARNNGINSVLLVGTPPQMLLGLKMTRDLGLAVFAAPLTSHSNITFLTTTQQVLSESVAYWRYVLLGE